MNLDWSSPTFLFDTGFGSSNALGITYDPVTTSLWVSQWSGVAVTLGGSTLSSFNVDHATITSLAMDRADHTLWLGSQRNEGTFQQFSVAGVAGETRTYSNMIEQNTLGGEFADVPEPASGLLLGGALAGLLALRRRRC